MAYSKIPLNLPHAGTIAERIARNLDERVDWAAEGNAPLRETVRRLQEVLLPSRMQGENPPGAESEQVKGEAAKLGRELVDEVEKLKLGGDRLGQCVRNLFECLELGEEGAAISLRAGEDPRSAQRPV